MPPSMKIHVYEMNLMKNPIIEKIQNFWNFKRKGCKEKDSFKNHLTKIIMFNRFKMTWSITLCIYLLPIHPPIYLVIYLTTYYPPTHPFNYYLFIYLSFSTFSSIYLHIYLYFSPLYNLPLKILNFLILKNHVPIQFFKNI
jgi:hypothetical protein